MTSRSSRNAAELAGQSMLLRFEGPHFTHEAREAFRRIRPAGILFFADNITSRGQIHALCAELQHEARTLGMPPLFIAADQEGGIVSRFSPDFVTLPGAMALTANGRPEDIETAAQMTGEQLREVGINTNFAPVVDVNNNPENPVIRTRSFGDTVERVITGALATIRGLTGANVIPTVKHFPGHGDTSVDSHLDLPVIPHSLERLHQIELAPYKAAIEDGVPAVMTTHIVFPILDEHPATLSRPILTGLLREELGFEGAIFTDSLSMDAIDQRYGLADTAIRCKAAGVDVLEANESLDKQFVRFDALVAAIEDDSLPRRLFENTRRRLAHLRTQFQLDQEPGPLADPPTDRLTRAREIAGRTIVALGDHPFTPIASTDRPGIIDFQRLRSSEAEDPFNRAGVLREAARAALPNVDVATLSHTPDEHELHRATEVARTAGALVILTRDARDHTDQLHIAHRLLAERGQDSRVIHVALRGPYDAGILGTVDSTLLTFGDPAISLQALVDVLAGKLSPTGQLPVALPARSNH